jgi:hypothetical protein
VGASFSSEKSSIGGRSEYDTYNGLSVSAYLHEADRTLTVVLVNMRASDERVRIELPASLSLHDLQVHLTSNAASFARQKDLPVSSGRVDLTAPGYSVLTLHGKTDGL